MSTLDQLASDPSSPRFVRPELKRYLSTLALVDRLCAGPETMWEHSEEYIRKWPDESPEVYKVRRKSEEVFLGLKRTINAATGMLFAKEPMVVWGPAEARLKPLWDNIDGKGTKGSVFAKQFADREIKHGLALILVDHPSAPRDAQGRPITITAANEAQFNMRPMWAMYARGDILNWREEVVDNVKTITQLTLFEPQEEVAGEFGMETVNYFRVLSLIVNPGSGSRVARWRVLREKIAGDGTVTYEEQSSGNFRNRNGQLATFLPIAIAYAGVKYGTLCADVPLDGVAYANLGMWQYATDLKFNRRVCGFEQMIISGELQADPAKPNQKPSIKMGPLVAIHMEQGGTITWSGPSGSGLAQLEKGVGEKMVQMDQQGLGFLLPSKTVTTTATEARIDSYAQLSTLATAGVGLQDAVNLAWEHTAWYAGLTKADAPVMTINTDFEASKLEAAVMKVYVDLVKEGFPKLLVLQQLQNGGRIPEEADLDLLAIEWEGELQAQREIEKLRLESQQNNNMPPNGPQPTPEEEGGEDDDAA